MGNNDYAYKTKAIIFYSYQIRVVIQLSSSLSDKNGRFLNADFYANELIFLGFDCVFR